MPRCPSCQGEAPPSEENDAFPFCSARCRLIDLGRWLSGAYAVPGKGEERDPPSEPGEPDVTPGR